MDGGRRSGRPPLSERRKAETKREIAHTAVRLFAARGLAGTSWDDLAQAVGVSTRTLTRYFATKEECVRPLLTGFVEEFVATVRAWPAARPLAELAGPDWPPADEASAMRTLRELVGLVRAEPRLRGVWLDLHHEAEAVMTALFAERIGEAPGGLRAPALAVVVNGTIRRAVEEWVDQGEEGASYGAVVRDMLRLTVGPVERGLVGA